MHRIAGAVEAVRKGPKGTRAKPDQPACTTQVGDSALPQPQRQRSADRQPATDADTDTVARGLSRQHRSRERLAADQQRKNALFAAPAAGAGGLGSLYG